MNIRTFIIAAGIVAGSAAVTAPAMAMPPFAQAYGVQCNVCHTQVPALNTYGRYVQRTGYASLDPHVLHRALPIWVGENTWYDTQDPAEPHRTQFGNVAIHAVGAIGNDVTYHFQQWIKQNNQSGDLDTFWMTYNNLLHRDGHLFVGLVEAPGPSPYSQWMDLSGFAASGATVGEHTYEIAGNGWGSKFNYVKGSLDLEAGWLYGGSGWGQSSAFINSDKRFQFKVAYANPEQPLEVGVFGSRGSWPLAEGGFSQYWSEAGYVQRDPTHGVPGILAVYQTALDGNPGYTTLANGSLAPLGAAGSNASTFELYQPILDKGLVSVRQEWTNDGLGTSLQTGNADFSYQIARFVHLYVETYWQQHAIPGWRYMLWWTTPISRVK
jgi:hypothetical protein